MEIIQVENLTRDYGKGKGIFNLSFEVKKGEVFGFLGPNGSGKTTTIRHLMGFIQAKSGHCTIDGRDCWKEAVLIQSKLGYIPGEISFFDEMTGLELLNFFMQYRGLKDSSRMQELLAYLELDPKVKIKKMSKGMKQKVGIVLAFMHDPDILILDEPTSGLDPLMQNRFIELILKEKQQGKTILLSSHMFEEVEKTCDRVGIIRAGKLVEIDSVDALRAKHAKTYQVTLESEQLAHEFSRDFAGVCEGNSVTVSPKLSLEEIFIHYYGDDHHD